MSFTIGQGVAVKAGRRDPDTETSLMGWCGIVIAFHPEDGIVETIKKGRPYTLRLIKTQASFERALKDWEEDVALLKQLKAI